MRLEVRKVRDEHVVRFEPSWPLRGLAYTPLYLDARTESLAWQPSSDEAFARYRSTGGRQPVMPEEIVPVEIEILASSTLLEAGSSLAVDVLGHDAARYPAFRHRHTVNRGYHTIHAGGRFDSHLLLPRVS